MTYNTKYGATVLQRATRMSNNAPPYGERLPRIRRVTQNGVEHVFDGRCCYLSNIEGTPGNLVIWCKSQKWFQTHLLYKLSVKPRLRSGRFDRLNSVTATNCSCKDYARRGNICKHMTCVELVNRTIVLRF